MTEADLIAAVADEEAVVSGPLLFDTFTDVDGVLLQNHTPDKGGPWVAEKGALQILSNKAAPKVTEGIALVDVGQSDILATYIADIDPGTAFGFVFRGVDDNNFLLASVFQNTLFVQSKISGGFAILGQTGATAVGAGVPVSVSAKGVDILFTVGAGFLAVSSSLFLTETKVGLRNGAGTLGRIDDLLVIKNE